MGYAEQHLRESIEIIEKMDVAPIERMADLLAQVKTEGGRIFFLGVGGSAGSETWTRDPATLSNSSARP